MPKAVLFDLDRTLVDVQSFTDYAAALADVVGLLGSWSDVETPATDWDAPTQRCMEVLVALAGDPRWIEVSAVIEQHELAGAEQSQAMWGVEEALERTAKVGRAVVTLLPEGAARVALIRHGIDIPMLLGRSPVHRPKPAPDQLHAALSVLGCAPEQAVMVGDSSWDHRAALAAGCTFVGVTNGSDAAFGDEVAETAPDLAAALDLAGL